jgi:predicted HTH transcriptional regulator
VYYNSLQNTFIRTGSGDQRATEFEINALFRDQTFGTMSEKTVEGTSIESLNKSSYNRFRAYLKWRNPDLRYNQMDDNEFNRRLKIVKDGKLTYGGLLFLGKNEEITDTFSDFRIDYFEIPGTSYSDAQVRYTYRIDEQENLWEYYFVLFQRLKIYANNPLTIGEMGIGHEDTKEIDALREALVNLLIHTDYFSIMKPRIRVFTNRIEFENPGSLPRPVEELLKADESLPRNPVLAKFFRIAKLCESAGYGFDKMLEWRKQTGNEVLFETTIDKTKFTFMVDTTIINSEGDTETEESGMKKAETVEKTVEKTKKTVEKKSKTVEKTVEKKPKAVEKTIEKIIRLMAENQYITTYQLSDMINISVSAINQQIAKLKKQEIIRRDGADKGGKWIIIKSK